MIGGGVVLRAFLGNISSIESSRFPLQKFRNPGVVAESVSFSNSRRLGGLLLTEPPAPDVSPNQTQDAESKKRQLTGLRDGTMSRDQGYHCAASGDPVHWTSSHSPHFQCNRILGEVIHDGSELEDRLYSRPHYRGSRDRLQSEVR